MKGESKKWKKAYIKTPKSIDGIENPTIIPPHRLQMIYRTFVRVISYKTQHFAKKIIDKQLCSPINKHLSAFVNFKKHLAQNQRHTYFKIVKKTLWIICGANQIKKVSKSSQFEQFQRHKLRKREKKGGSHPSLVRRISGCNPKTPSSWCQNEKPLVVTNT